VESRTYDSGSSRTGWSVTAPPTRSSVWLPMNIRFNPPQLEDAQRSETLRRLAEEMVPQDFQGELRVLQSFPDEPMRLVLIKSGSWPASLQLPRSWLYSEVSEKEMRTRLAELIHSFEKPALAA
jgi:hypothetical protein